MLPRGGSSVGRGGVTGQAAEGERSGGEHSTGFGNRKKVPNGGLELQGSKCRLHWPRTVWEHELRQEDKKIVIYS